jgi:hypothetical protein
MVTSLSALSMAGQHQHGGAVRCNWLLKTIRKRDRYYGIDSLKTRMDVYVAWCNPREGLAAICR